MRLFTSSEVLNRLAIGCFAAALPMFFMLSWLLHNNQLPGNDAANYLLSAVNIYHAFTDQGIVKGLLHFYTERGWRPIFFPNIAAPFLLLTQGNLFLSYWCVAVLCLLASTTYSYLFFRLTLNRIPALLATNLIGLLPFVQAQLVMFYAEGALFPCAIGCLYHLIRSNYLRNVSHTLGFVVLLTLALWIRPVEAVTNLIFVFLLFLYSGWRQRYFSISDLLQLVAIVLLCVSLFFAAAFKHYFQSHIVPVMDNGGVLDAKMMHVLSLCVRVSAILFLTVSLFCVLRVARQWQNIVRQRLERASSHSLLVPAFATIGLLCLVWFMPFAFDTYQWIYRTSLGDVASSTGDLAGPSFSLSVLKIYVREEGLLVILGALLMAVIGWFAQPSRERLRLAMFAPVLYLILLMPFPVWEAFYTVQVVTRKLSLAFPAALMALLLFALAPGKWLRTRCYGIAILILAQFGLLLTLTFTDTYTHPIALLNRTIGYFIPHPSTIKPNPHDVVQAFFAEQATAHHLRSFALELVPGTPDARHPIEAEPINPFLFSTILQAKKTPYYAGYPYFSLYSDDNAKHLAESYDAVFLSDSVNDMVISPTAAQSYQTKFTEEKSASIKTFYYFMMHYASNRLADIGFERGPCIVIKTQKSGDYLGCLLLNNHTHSA